MGWLDTQIRQGNGPDFVPVHPPYVPGGSVAGTVRTAGDGVPDDRVGERVIVGTTAGYAERATAPADSLIPVPDELGLREALALLDDGSTAVALLERTPVRADEWVLVQPSMGGLGSLLIQLVRAEGAKVLAAARGEDKLAMATALGADAVVDYTESGWPARARAMTGGAGIDVVFDGVGGAIGQAALDMLGQRGWFSGYGGASGAPTPVAVAGRVSTVGMEQLAEFHEGRIRRVEHLLAEMAAGRIVPTIGQTYPLDRAVDAHSDIEARRFVGKSLLVL